MVMRRIHTNLKSWEYISKMEKLLTIIIPTYNMEKYLHRCLDSLLVSKVYMDMMEVLIINDGSKDSSSAIGHTYESNYPRTFRVIDKQNGNYGSCVNRGLMEASGKFVKILDADDFYQTAHLEQFVCMLKDVEADLVLTDMVFVYSKERKIYQSFDFPADIVHSATLMAHSDFRNKMEMHHVTYKKDVLDRINYQQTEGISYTDQEWIFYPMMAVNSISYIPIDIYQYMLDRGGQTMDMEVEARCVDHKITIAKRMIEYLKEGRFDHPSKEVYARCRLSRFLRLIYKLVLLYQTDNQYRTHLKLLENMDIMVKSNLPYLYDESNSYVISSEIPMKFVKYWRVRRCRYPLFVLKLHRQIKGLDVLLRKMHLRG